MVKISAVIGALVDAMLSTVDPDVARSIADKALDKIEDKVKETDTKIDDVIVLNFIKRCIREPFGIEDNDMPAEAEELADAELEGAD